jgi:hypothetical protein
VLAIAQEIARGRPPTEEGEILLPRHEITALAKTRGLSRQSVSSAWRPLAARRLLRLIEPGSVALRLPP